MREIEGTLNKIETEVNSINFIGSFYDFYGMNISDQLQKLDEESSKHWLQQFEESLNSKDFKNLEFVSFNLLRFFRCIKPEVYRHLYVDDFYRKVMMYIRETESIEITPDILIFKIISLISISDFYRCYLELNQISANELDDTYLNYFKFIMAVCFSFFKRYDQVSTILTDIIPLDEYQNVDLKLRLAFSFYKLKKYSESKEIFNDILNNDLQHKYLTKNDIIFHFANQLLFTGDHKQAIKLFMNLASINPETSFLQIAYFYAQNSNFEKAIDILNRIDKSHRTLKVSILLGFLLYRLNKLNEAFDILIELTKFTVLLSPANEIIGLIYYKLGQFNKAVCYLKNAYILDSSNLTYTLNYALSLEQSNESAEVAKVFYEKLRDKAYFWEIYSNRLALLNLFRMGKTNPLILIEEPELEMILQSPTDEQIDNFFQAPPYLPSCCFSFLENVPDKIPTVMQQRIISYFPED
ncbi:hypothetical protein TRFO_34637 [Tritrichomonas foetus]|uniref:TPR Domain containing protein n=1 Tax=Tritrichomonas foetus TaxID=1144522 RepID=A0A1J4JNA9_9EUKA|nr:hypothetical protein TRFO_34637 [Tritrichomonas foetus]|eukprot:OHS98989.1 hypothetical protein TRFO_34637 [Tritrichomonas foetus]